MNTNVRLAIVAATSFTIGYLFANWKNEEYYFTRANEEIRTACEGYEETVAELEEKLEAIRAGSESNARVDEEIREASLILQEASAKAKYQETLKTYQGVEPAVLQPNLATVPKIQYSDYITPEEPVVPPKDKPNVDIIDDDQFLTNPDDYDQHTLQYYIGDNVLFDDLTGEFVEDGERRNIITGDRADLLKREGFWNTQEVWYLRNHDLKKDFEIIGNSSKWADDHESSGVDE